MSHHFDGRGFRIHFVEQGHGPAVVFAHGFEMDHTMFAPQFEELPKANRCIAWDMRGHGDSACPDGPWLMQDLVVDLIRFIEGTNAAPCHLVGMSIGGMAAVRLALQREDLLRSLVLIDTTADRETDDSVELYKGFQQRIQSEDGLDEQLAREVLPIFYGPDFMAREPEVMEIHVRRSMEMPTVSHVEGIRALVTRRSVVDRLAEIHLPTLVIHGEGDAAIPIAQAETLANGIAGAELVRIPDCGHTAPLEAPDLVNRVLVEFVDRVG